MRVKSSDSLSITQCCEVLGIDKKELLKVFPDINGPQEVIDRLKLLLDRDKSIFESCQTIEQYEVYLSTNIDGLYCDSAKEKIALLKVDAEELVFYDVHQNSISDLETYIKKYPNGRFIQEAKVSLANKKKTRKIRNIILLILLLIVAVVVCLINYSSVSYLDISYVDEDAYFGKMGGGKKIFMATDAYDIEYNVSSDRIGIDRDNSGFLSISVGINEADTRIDSIIVNAYTSFFGKKFNCISKTIIVAQESGLATFIDAEKTDMLLKEKALPDEIVYFCNVETDGTIWYIHDYPNWLSNVEADITNNKLKFKARENIGDIRKGKITINAITVKNAYNPT